MEIKYSARDLAKLLRDSGARIHDPNPEQTLIIESQHSGPTLIIAGAGSGKTETMSARVVWLVANKIVTPDQILGLTFTRKAAGELSARIRTRLRQLKSAGIIGRTEDADAIDLGVSVSTYHSYAGKVLTEHGIRIGIDSDSEPIGEAAAWQIANSIVRNFEGDLRNIKHTPDTVVTKVLNLVDQLGEHGKTTKELEGISDFWIEKFSKDIGGTSNAIKKTLETLYERKEVIKFVEQYNKVRTENSQLTFSDQMSMAAELATGEAAEEIAAIERSKYKIVLLDEYQDTSFSQVRFLSGLFGSNQKHGIHSVTAVGDPNQSIYGWRGASAGTMAAFASAFGATETCAKFTLLTTWRNDKSILGVANQTISELKNQALMSPKFSKIADSMDSVGELQARNGAGVGEVALGLYESLQSEAQAIANYFAENFNAPERLAKPTKERTSFAVLVRSKKYITEIEKALRENNLPVEVVGLGGLIHIPEVADVIALLRTLINPDAGSSLMRILAGPHLSLGARDLQGFGQYIRDLSKKDGKSSSQTLLELLENGDSSVMEADDFASGSAIDALDSFESAPASYFSKVGYARLVKLSKELQSLRRQLSGSITDSLIEVERYLYLDSEVLLHHHNHSGRRYLDQFLDEASKFERTGGTLNSFLEWLKIADDEESGIKVSNVSVTTEAVQILTVHSAKGLEWDFVSVPGLVEKNFPSSGKEGTAWTTNFGEIFIEMRGDRQALVDLEFPGGTPSSTQVNKALDNFKEDISDLHKFEEFRLGYVAFTRAKSNLICTASWFGEGVKVVKQSELFSQVFKYIEENPSHGRLLNSEEEPTTENPIKDNPRTGVWPQVNSRAEMVRKSAELVKASAELKKDELAKLEPLIYEDALAILNEIENRDTKLQIALPVRMSVSTLVNLKQDPNALALNIRRPLPNHIDQYARRGTEFHLWIEKRYKDLQLFDDDIFDSDFAGEPDKDLPLKELQDKWLASEWAKLEPVPGGIEVPFETVVAGVLLRGRIDAVYKVGEQYTVVDWKTGKVKSGDDLETAAIQLAMYRLAYSKLYGIPIEKISAAFHYVGSNETVSPADLYSERELEEIITSNLAL